MIKNLESVFYFGALSICCFTFVLLLLSRHHIRHFPSMLISLIALFLIGLIIQLLMHTPQAYWKHVWMYAAIIHSFLVGPMVWLFAKQLLGEKYIRGILGPVKKSLFVMAAIMASPLIFLIYNGPDWNSPNYPNSILFWQGYYVLSTGYVILYFVQALWYLQLCMAELSKASNQKIKVKNLFLSSVSDPIRVQILGIILNGYLAIIVINAARVIHCGIYGMVPLASQIQSFLDISVTVWILSKIIVKLVAARSSPNSEMPLKSSQITMQKYQNSSLDLASRKRIQTKLQQAIGDPEVFTDSSLNLSKLANKLGERHHYVSQVINQDLSSTFFEFINQARVVHAQKLITQNSSLSMVDLAEIVGFNSKTTFYSAFNKHLGTTPAKYKKSLASI